MVFSSWRFHRPSRTTFAALIDELDQLELIEKRQSSAKASANELHLNAATLRRLLSMPEDLSLSDAWCFQDGTFDMPDLNAAVNPSADEATNRVARRDFWRPAPDIWTEVLWNIHVPLKGRKSISRKDSDDPSADD